jgi:hypothetical protein
MHQRGPPVSNSIVVQIPHASTSSQIVLQAVHSTICGRPSKDSVATLIDVIANIGSMLSKPIELPPTVARRFIVDMLAYFAEPNSIKRDEIAARQLHALRQHYSGKLRLTDVTAMFVQMRDHA